MATIPVPKPTRNRNNSSSTNHMNSNSNTMIDIRNFPSVPTTTVPTTTVPTTTVPTTTVPTTTVPTITNSTSNTVVEQTPSPHINEYNSDILRLSISSSNDALYHLPVAVPSSPVDSTNSSSLPSPTMTISNGAELQQQNYSRNSTGSMNSNQSQTKKNKSIKNYIRKSLYGKEILDLNFQQYNSTNNNPFSNDINCNSYIRQRIILSYMIYKDETMGSDNPVYKPTISLKQNKIKKNEKSPQGALPDTLSFAACKSYDVAKVLCESLSPPKWASKNDNSNNTCCLICNFSFALLRPSHHCRNCGYLVCSDCSSKTWPSSMIPITYHSKESYVRVCDCCFYLTEKYAEALKAGDLNRVIALYSTGNINLYTPLSVYSDNPYSVHLASQSGNVELMIWLTEKKFCAILDKSSKETKPLMNAHDLSCLAIAAKYGHLSMMRYLIHVHNANINELTFNLSLLTRALHVALEVPGSPPEYIAVTTKFLASADNVTDNTDLKLTKLRKVNDKAIIKVNNTVLKLQDDLLHGILGEFSAITDNAYDINENSIIDSINPTAPAVADLFDPTSSSDVINAEAVLIQDIVLNASYIDNDSNR